MHKTIILLSYACALHAAQLSGTVTVEGSQPRDGRFPWQELPKMLDIADKAFELNAGCVWRGDNNRSGVYPSPGIRDASEPAWSYDTGGKVLSSPLVVDGKMYIGAVKGALCLSAENGSLIWEYPIKGGSDSSACFHEGVVYIGGNDAKLHAIDADTGENVWTSKATGPLVSSPCVAYGVVFCGHATGVSLDKGKPVWGLGQKLGPIVQVSDGRLTSPAVDSEFYSYAAFSGRHIDIQTGMGPATTWEGQNTYPIVDGVIYGINSGMGGNMKTPDLLAHRASKKLWTGRFQGGDTKERYIAISPPAIWEDSVFVASDFGDLVAFDRRKGKELWRHTFKRGLAIRSGPSVSEDGLVYLGTHDHHVYCIDGKNGKTLWSFETGGPIRSSACIADGMVFIGSDDGSVYAFASTATPDSEGTIQQ